MFARAIHYRDDNRCRPALPDVMRPALLVVDLVHFDLDDMGAILQGRIAGKVEKDVGYDAYQSPGSWHWADECPLGACPKTGGL